MGPFAPSEHEGVIQAPPNEATLTEFVQHRDESGPRLQVLGPQPVQRDQQERLLLEAATQRRFIHVTLKED